MEIKNIPYWPKVDGWLGVMTTRLSRRGGVGEFTKRAVLTLKLSRMTCRGCAVLTLAGVAVPPVS